jgi:hypothetical protein
MSASARRKIAANLVALGSEWFVVELEWVTNN